MLLENKSRYLPNDELLLHCEYVSSNGTVSFEFCSYGIIFSNAKTVVVKKEPIQQMPDLVSELKAAYNDGIHSDMELRTSTKSYPVHKFILSARSPVFKRMFSSDMKEKNCGHVDVTDLEDDTVHQMLQYLYTDTLEDLKLENAYKLYTAADKYQIMSLRSKCSSFLKDNLIPDKACAFMVLADLHSDDDLRRVVQDYILKHDQEVFGSQEWKHFMDTNPKLAADVMFRKVFPH
ncbi:Speckle-type POZ protein like [Argiope bruennichi]|uniref:Speckle-type POZ protein like n=1 Tax=Argiope bruennichi TaxID=94029 RepID=A0A8T0F9G0_ARGBR|nr:Speckle-type POZ protein like [Argiope bruennichi]